MWIADRGSKLIFCLWQKKSIPKVFCKTMNLESSIQLIRKSSPIKSGFKLAPASNITTVEEWELTTKNTRNSSSQTKWDSIISGDIDHPVKQVIVRINIGNQVTLAISRLQVKWMNSVPDGFTKCHFQAIQ